MKTKEYQLQATNQQAINQFRMGLACSKFAASVSPIAIVDGRHHATVKTDCDAEQVALLAEMFEVEIIEVPFVKY